jgi:hypothetical protein
MHPRTIALTLALLGFAVSAVAQPGRGSPATIQVTGEATVTRAPDRVQAEVAVVTRSESSREAVAANARQTRAVIEALRKEFGEQQAELQSVGYALHPEYRRPEDGAPAIAGYSARNTVRIVLDDVERIGDAIDLATRAGANQVQRVTFSLQDEGEARAAALEAAATDARTTADRVAESLEVSVTGVRSVVVSGPPMQPVRELAMARTTTQTPTPIISGPIEVRASVSVTFDVAPTGDAARR